MSVTVEVTDNVFGERALHFEGRCETTGCLHCSACGMGPQTYLTYRYEAQSVNGSASYAIQTLGCGLCPRCASRG